MEPGQIFMGSYLSTVSPERFFFFFHQSFQFSKFYILISLSLTWDPMGAKISKRYFSHIMWFHVIIMWFQQNFMRNMLAIGNIGHSFSWRSAKNLKKIMALWHFCLQKTHGLEIKKQNTIVAVFIQSQPNLTRTLATMTEYRLLLFFF